MKNKFLSFAVVSAMLALLAIPGVAFGDSSVASVSVTENTTLSIQSMGSNISSPSFSVNSFGSNDVRSVILSGTTLIVQDYTGGTASFAGHKLKMKFDKSTWHYNDKDSQGADLTLATTYNGNPGTNEIAFVVAGTEPTSSSRTFAKKSEANCSASGAIASLHTPTRLIVSTTATEFQSTSEDCAGDTTYVLDKFRIKGPSNGFYGGQYTITGTISVVDAE